MDGQEKGETGCAPCVQQLSGDHFESGQLDGPMIPCMAAPGPEGGIIHVPNDIIAISQDAHDPNIIHHKARTTPPPLVAPHSDNLEAVEEHIRPKSPSSCNMEAMPCLKSWRPQATATCSIQGDPRWRDQSLLDEAD
jgi:hypothetical protein